jgi:uncharacterized OB-fold protein/NAD(P)-dependent dehydrogenase (short-subunit alcohol dehydrogenase family)
VTVLTPPSMRSRAAGGLTEAAAFGSFELQVCRQCSAVQYPPREVCGECLADDLHWRSQDGAGELLASTVVHVSHDPYFRQRAPWRVAMVRLDCGPTVIAHLHSACAPSPSRVRIAARLDNSGQGVLIAFPCDSTLDMTQDRQLREWTCDPRSRAVFVTDGASALGLSLIRDLIAVGADLVWAGVADSLKDTAAVEAIRALPQVKVVPLDVTDATSVERTACEIGERLDILINNSDADGADASDEAARPEMDANDLALPVLADRFVPVLRSRAQAGKSGMTAWVNVLSVAALSKSSAFGSHSMPKAVASSPDLRTQLRGTGVRVINVFAGPLAGARQQAPSSTLTSESLARAIVSALRDSVQDVYPGDVAQQWLARWRESPDTSAEVEAGQRS